MSPSKSPPHVCHYELIKAKKFFKCNGCKMNGLGTRFNCKGCRRELHRECMNPKTHINHEYFGCSTLTFVEKPFMKSNKPSKQKEYSKFCDACLNDIRGFSYHCGKRKLDLHPCCANLKKKLLVDGTVFNLVSEVSSECKMCHKTKISIEKNEISGWSYVSTCQTYNFHVYCLKGKLHEDRMKHGNSELEKVELNQLTEAMINLICLICNLISFFIGLLCKTSISESRGHDCYDHYELKTYNKHFTCDGCKMNGFGQRYTCNPCGNELHKECRYHKTEISHEYFVGSTFTFLEKPLTKFSKSSKRRVSCSKCISKCCSACGKYIIGFSYHCEADNLYLHPCCSKLKKKRFIYDTVFNLGSKVSSKCMWCKKRKISDGERDVPGWSYVSSCGKYSFHVYCVTEMEHEAYMKHGNPALKKVDFMQLTKTKSNGGSGRTTLGILKSLLKIAGSVLLGDPTLLIANVVVESFTGGKQC